MSYLKTMTIPTDRRKLSIKLKVEYDSIRLRAERLSHELKKQLEAVIVRSGISLALPVETRVKSWESVESKISRLSLSLKSIHDLQDLVGARVILLFRRDCAALCELVGKTFDVLGRVDTSERLKENEFGYSSTHFRVKLPRGWESIPTLAGLGDLTAELQIRTISQHTWAAASHILQYKDELNVPIPVRRSIHRVSALLETVDLEFERVLVERENYRAHAKTNSSEILNTDLLEKVLDSLLPAANKDRAHESYSLLLKELNHFDVNTAGHLTEIIRKHLPKILERDAALAKEQTKNPAKSEESWKRASKKGVYFYHAGLVRNAMNYEFGKRWQDYFSEVLKEIRRTKIPRSRES